MCTVLLPPGVNLIAVKKYIISHNIKHSNTIENCYSMFTQLNSRLYSSSSDGGGGGSGGVGGSSRSSSSSSSSSSSGISGNNNSVGGRFNNFLRLSAGEAISTLKQ